jgi:LPXTG-motif cell wall-anchored protein
VLSTVLVSAALLGPTAPALAAPGDAAALGVDFNLAAAVLGVPVITADATIGTATAPPGGGTDSDITVPIVVPGALNVVATGAVVEVTATRGPISSSASSVVTDPAIGILGINVLTASEITAAVSCPFGGTQAADTTLTGLQLFGTAVNPVVNGPPTTGTSPVTVAGLVGASLDVALTRTETITAGGAAATALLATIALNGNIAAVPVTIPVGTVTVAQATCSRPDSAAAPTAASIAPNSGPQSGGQTVTITGTNFIIDGTTVTFDGAPATSVTVAGNGTSLTATTPAGAVGPASVLVTTDGGAASPLDYTYLADGSGANVTNLAPTSGPTAGGTVVTITGTGFTGATGVNFGGTPGTAFTVNPAGTTITVTTPSHAAGAVPVELVFPGGTAAAGNFTYVAPTITGVDPAQGPTSGGTAVTVTGTGLTGATDVTFGGIPGTNLVVNPAGTSLTVTTPPGPVGPVDVVVVLPGPDATSVGGYTYLLAAPTLGTVTPAQGPTSGGTDVTVTGSGFVPGQTVVNICGRVIPASGVTVSPNGLSLTFTTPSCPAGDTTITVTTPAGTSNGLGFRYNGPGLPVTGTSTSTLLLIGLAMMGAGVLALLLIRRRRLSFVS